MFQWRFQNMGHVTLQFKNSLVPNFQSSVFLKILKKRPQFATKESTVTKWVMNRPYQTKFVESLLELSGVCTTMSNPRKCLRSSEILKSNKMVERIMVVLKTQFINPSDTIHQYKQFVANHVRKIRLTRAY